MNSQHGRPAARALMRLVLAVALAVSVSLAACGGSGGGSDGGSDGAEPTAVDSRDYSNFSPEAAMLSVNDLPPGFTELERRPPALQGANVVQGTLYRFAGEGGIHYAYSEVVLLTVEAEPVAEESLRTMMRGLGFPDIRSATVDDPEPDSTLVVGVGGSDLLGLGGPADTDIVFEVLSFTEGRVIALVGTAYPVGAPREPSSEAIAKIVLDRIRAQTGGT